MINVNKELSPGIENAMDATAKKLYELRRHRYTGIIFVEFNMLDGGIAKASEHHVDNFYMPEKRK